MSDDNVSSLNVAKFYKNSDPAAHNPVTALDAAREWLKELDHEPSHIIVMVGRDMPDGGSRRDEREFSIDSNQRNCQK